MMETAVERLKAAFEDITADRKTIVKILSVVLILLIAAVLRIHETNKADITVESAQPAASEASAADEAITDGSVVIFVDISGAVAEPGVYQVASDTRLYEVIEMAGGLTEDADADSVNRASFVEDGQKIIIPEKGDTASVSAASDSASAAGISADGLININTASADQLKTLNGIGDTMAQRIIEYRTSNAFKSKEDIMSVKGIGSGIYDKIKDRITC